MKKDMVFLFIVLGGFFVSCTSWLDANSCHMGTSKAVAIFSKVGYEGDTSIRERLSRAIPNFSERLVIVYPFSLITSFILFIFLFFTKIRLLQSCDINISLIFVNGDNVCHYIFVYVIYICYICNIKKEIK